MYPHVIQFKSRDRLVAEQLELLRIRNAAAGRAGARPIWRRFRQSPQPLSSAGVSPLGSPASGR